MDDRSPIAQQLRGNPVSVSDGVPVGKAMSFGRVGSGHDGHRRFQPISFGWSARSASAATIRWRQSSLGAGHDAVVRGRLHGRRCRR